MDHSDQDNSHTYAYKHNRYSSHNQIIDSVIPHSTVLDIGCGEGIISRHLHEKNCMVVGVDRKEPDPSFTRFMDDYFDQDLEESLTAISEKNSTTLSPQMFWNTCETAPGFCRRSPPA
jgi:16S rRNA A1518/A1519 N6-dimethyltransferase RsmA/KsgA/DIM1 with predicted DNA glycosylase/AP lyase activity